MAQQKIVGYRLVIDGTDKTDAALKRTSDRLREAIQLAIQLGDAMNKAFGGTATEGIKEFEDELAKLKKRAEEIGDGLGDQVLPDTEEATEDLEDYLKALRDLGKETGSNQQQLRAYNAALKSGALEGTELYDDLIKEVARLKNEQQDLNRTIKQQQKEFQQAEVAADSYKGLQIELGKLRNEWRQLSKAEREANEDQLKRIGELDQQLKALDEDMGIYTRNVGNYRSVWDALNGDLSDAPGIVSGVGDGFKALDAQIKFLLKNPIVLFIAALVGGLKLLFDAFGRSEQGANLFAKASGAVNAVLSLLTRFVSNAAEGIAELFNDPIGSIKAFGQSLVDNVLNRLRALVTLAVETGKAVGNVLVGDLDAAQAAASKAGQAFDDAFSIVDDETVERFAQGLRDVTAEVTRQVEAFAQLEAAKRQQTRVNQELEIQAAKLSKQEELLSATADDATLSFQQREEAAERARALVEQRANTELQIARGNLALLEQEFQLRVRNGEAADEIRQQRTDAVVAVIDAEKELLAAQRDNEQQRRELVQDRLERDLDILIDGFDNQKSINERLLDDERLTLRERQALLEKTRKLGEGTFDSQIATIQKFTDLRIDANELLATSDARVLNKRIRSLGLSEIIEGRLLEVVRERRVVIQDLVEAQEELNAKKQEELATGIELTFQEQENLAQIAQEKRLISREEFTARMISLEITRLEEEIRLLELNDQEKTAKEQELALLREERVTANYERDLAAAQEAFDNQQAQAEINFSQQALLLEERFANEDITRLQRDEQRAALEAQRQEDQLQAERDFIEAQIELGTTYSLDVIGQKQALADKELEIAENKNAQLTANEQRTAEQRLAIQQQELSALGSFVGAVGDLLGQDEENRKKFAGVLKALALGEIAINLIRELSQINANPVVNADVTQATRALLTGAAIARAAVATVNVARQEFEQGGVVDAANMPSGFVDGPSHDQGGVLFVGGDGQLKEMQGGEFWLNNGPESMIIKKEAAAKNPALLRRLSANPSRFSMERKRLASAINVSGGGIPFFNDGGIDSAYTPVDAPIPSSLAQRVVLDGPLPSRPNTYAQRVFDALSNMGSNGGVSTVVMDPAEAYSRGKRQSKKRRKL